jgi:hypothetical protein
VGITFENYQLTNVWESTMWELDMGFVFLKPWAIL